MTDDVPSVTLRDAAAELALEAVCQDRVDHATAASCLLAAAAILIALQDEGERQAFLVDAWATMPPLVEHHVPRFDVERISRGMVSVQ